MYSSVHIDNNQTKTSFCLNKISIVLVTFSSSPIHKICFVSKATELKVSEMSLSNLFLLINLGCEMLYIIDQRLSAQNIAKDKSAQGEIEY